MEVAIVTSEYDQSIIKRASLPQSLDQPARPIIDRGKTT
jgi:hypothetical protein